MSLVVKDSGGGDFVPPPAGPHPARCFAIIDIGTQFSRFYDKWSKKVVIGWTFSDEDDPEKNYIVWKRYTASLHRNAGLRADLQNWRGKAFTEDELEGFELRNILMAPCLLNVSHRKDGDTVYADVSTVMPLPKGMTAPPKPEKTIVFDIDDPDHEVFESFSDGMKKTIQASREWQARAAEKGAVGEESMAGGDFHAADAAGGDDDGIPF